MMRIDIKHRVYGNFDTDSYTAEDFDVTFDDDILRVKFIGSPGNGSAKPIEMMHTRVISYEIWEMVEPPVD